MALFTDRGISTSEDLRAYESSVLDVASTEGIELDAKFTLAAGEIAMELSAYLVRQDTASAGMRDLNNIVVTDALANWHRLLTLALIYRDAYNSQMNDRYLGKWKEYTALALKAGILFFDIGIGVSSDPVPKPADPICTLVNGGALLAANYRVQIAWQNRRGAFGAPSNSVSIEMPAGTLLAVTPVDSPPGMAGWAVFLGRLPGEGMRQNATPIAPGATWFMSISGLQNGPALVSNQRPDYYITRDRQLRRG